jgi:hypothetical protein
MYRSLYKENISTALYLYKEDTCTEALFNSFWPKVLHGSCLYWALPIAHALQLLTALIPKVCNALSVCQLTQIHIFNTEQATIRLVGLPIKGYISRDRFMRYFILCFFFHS